MSIPETRISQFVVGEWRICPPLAELSGPGGRVQVESRSMDVLVYLAAHPGKVRTKEQIIAAVWGEAFVGDDVLTHAVWDLRRAFGDDAKSPRFIQTVHGKGYRLLAKVEMADADATLPLPEVEQVLHYRLLEKLGGGGMGVVYKAEDTRLGRTVALKFLAPDKTRDEQAKERFLREARAASALDHPNICTIHEIAESAEGQLFLVMACYDGETLAERIANGPVGVDEAAVIALQLAEGLAKAHGAGIVHRDIKPANVVVTGDGVVKLLDFGLAKLAGQTRLTGMGTTPGTIAYMAPEQLRGEEAGARSDVWSLGALLYELLSGTIPFPGGNSQAVIYGILNEQPRELRHRRPEIPDGLARIVERALEKDAGARYADAEEVLEDLRRVAAGQAIGLRPGQPERTPYPGLAAFREEDAEFFFGREAEVKRLWRRLAGQRLLGLIGPSGAGKSSFVRAGLLPAAPAGWGCLVTTPGAEPFIALGQAVAPELAAEPDALRQLPRVGQPEVAYELICCWRRRHREVLLVVDQFEELFTLNPDEVRMSFAALLGRLSADGQVHVLLSMRDDFLIRCHGHAALSPIFEHLTPLDAPQGPELRRALVEPAAVLGYEFETQPLVEEMLAEVEGERGALPLLAFTAAQLWERRDRTERRLTRSAYEEIGGVAGALGRYAERVIDRLGAERRPVVRELFRNLTTAQGTRAVHDREKLLTIFSEEEREEAKGVLDALVEARLLTAYEAPAADGEAVGRHRIEIVHESLLVAWPRLVRWQTQDAEAAQLRDELRQAAQMWEQHERSDDLLWTGTAFREYQLWRERYPGGVTASEAAFGEAMVRHAERGRRRRRLALAAIISILLAVVAVVGLSRQQAVDEARRAEASKLLALGRLEIEDYPTAAVAYSLASLELSDQPAARRLAVEALWRGPTASVLPGGQNWRVAFSPDGEWLAVGALNGRIQLWPRDGGAARALEHGAVVHGLDFGPDSRLLASRGKGGIVRLWSVPGGDLLHSNRFEGLLGSRLAREAGELVTLSREGSGLRVEAWSLSGGEPRVLGRLPLRGRFDVEPTGAWLARGLEQTLSLLRLDALETGSARTLGTQDSEITRVRFHRGGQRVATVDAGGEVRIWSVDGSQGRPLHTFRSRHRLGTTYTLSFDAEGSRAVVTNIGQEVWLWRLGGPPDAEPLLLRKGDVMQINDAVFAPDGRWLATADHGGTTLWPLARTYPAVLRRSRSKVWNVAIAPDGRWIASDSAQEMVFSPLAGLGSEEIRGPGLELPRLRGALYRSAVRPDGRYLLGGRQNGDAVILPVGGGEARALTGFVSQVWAVAWSPDGRLAAAAGGQHRPDDGVIRIWSADTGELVRTLDPGDGRWIGGLAFVSQRILASASGSGLRLWDLEDGSSEVLRTWDRVYGDCALSGDRRWLMGWGYDFESDESTEVVVHDLESGESRALPSHGRHVTFGALDAGGVLAATTDIHGVVRVGPTSGEQPHLLLGHEGMVWDLEFTPDGSRLITAGEDGTVRVWPRPEGTPLHTLPHEELLDRLRALTNLRAVPDESRATGYRLEPGPVTGWRVAPTW